ncbi:LysR substrate-binding domain-containing protein [Ruegeria sp. EL01]|jgi:DNA-binding transcriptional LysR family regulator|uniref:LysR substrate-binding domain-containing protein n=1 Tax=Ruegeria sp. EL01 TaxID=2107578 RepID=UPI000EA83792|nr:LysR substrate-binding domain-containing protein [Ruegeria sp. EL01]
MRRYIPSLFALRAFEASATTLSFTRAGEELGRTQSGVSRQVSNLEALLGIDLFERFGPRLVLTPAGESYAASVSEILNLLEEASMDVIRGSRASAALQIGVQDSFASRWLVPRMKHFMEAHPSEPFNVIPLRGDVDFADGPDIAVMRGQGAWRDAIAYKLITEFVGVVAAPTLVPPHQSLPIEEHQAFPKIQNAHRPDSWLRWLAAKGIEHHGPISGPRFSQTTMVIEATLAGIGLAVVPVFMIEEQLADGRLHLPFGAPVASGAGYYAVYPETRRPSTPVRLFRDWIMSETRGLR